MRINDALLNSGLPQYTNKKDFSKNDIKIIIEQIKNFDTYYKSGWLESDTRKTLINYVNNYCVVYRWYSLIIK